MSRLSEILGVEERQEFRFENTELCVSKDIIYYRNSEELWTELVSARFLYEMIAHPEKIEIIPQKPKLTEQQITAIKGRIAEGTPWMARDKDRTLFAYMYKPAFMSLQAKFHSDVGCPAKSNLFDFITFENSPVYLPYLLGDE